MAARLPVGHWGSRGPRGLQHCTDEACSRRTHARRHCCCGRRERRARERGRPGTSPSPCAAVQVRARYQACVGSIRCRGDPGRLGSYMQSIFAFPRVRATLHTRRTAQGYPPVISTKTAAMWVAYGARCRASKFSLGGPCIPCHASRIPYFTHPALFCYFRFLDIDVSLPIALA